MSDRAWPWVETRNGGEMFDVRVRMSIDPWTDADFVHAVEDACKRVSLCNEVDTSSAAGAAMAQSLLRRAGFPRAMVVDLRSTDEALRRVAHWQVVRDGAAG